MLSESPEFLVVIFTPKRGSCSVRFRQLCIQFSLHELRESLLGDAFATGTLGQATVMKEA